MAIFVVTTTGRQTDRLLYPCACVPGNKAINPLFTIEATHTHTHTHTTDCCLSLEVLETFESHDGRMIKIIDDVASQWEELAKALGFGEEDVDRIKYAFPERYEACREMLGKWMEGNENLISPVTWTTLIQSMINAGLVDVADNIREVIKFDDKVNEVNNGSVFPV